VVLDATGTIMAAAPAGAERLGQPAPAEIARAAHDLPADEVVDSDGVRRLYALAPLLERERIAIGVGVPLDPSFAQVDRLFWRHMGLLGCVFLLVGALAWIGGEAMIRRPLAALQRAIDAVRGGNLAARASPTTTVPEFVRLGQSFDAMATRLEGHEAELRAALERRELLLHELNHRVKNTLATVQSIAAQTARTTSSPAAFREAFLARIVALAKSHDLLTRSQWDGADLRELLAQQLAPYRQAPGEPATDRVALRGPGVWLPPRSALALGLVIHELATNAARHGSLAASTGRVAVDWTCEAGSPGPMLRMEWRETGGPPVAAPTRRGFGSRLIEMSVAVELCGEARLDFAPRGLRCTIAFPLASAEASAVDAGPAERQSREVVLTADRGRQA
jgi:two-component sensor histidine kinase